MATKYRNMDGKEFLDKLSHFEPDLQRICLQYGTRLFELPEFKGTMERLRGNVGYTPNLERLRAPGFIAPRLYLPPQSILSETVLSETVLSDADLSGTNLRGAYLRGADLQWAGLFDADLSGTNLREAHLFMADLRGAHIELAIGLTKEQLDSC